MPRPIARILARAAESRRCTVCSPSPHRPSVRVRLRTVLRVPRSVKYPHTLLRLSTVTRHLGLLFLVCGCIGAYVLLPQLTSSSGHGSHSSSSSGGGKRAANIDADIEVELDLVYSGGVITVRSAEHCGALGCSFAIDLIRSAH